MKQHCIFYLLMMVLVPQRTFKWTSPCSSLRSIRVTAFAPEPFETVVDNCLESYTAAFKNKTITEIQVKNQNIPFLGRDSVRHLVHLKRISFENCSIESLDFEAFRNVFRVDKINLNDNKIRTLPYNVFGEAEDLNRVQVERNLLETLEDGTFFDMNKLKQVHLGWNRLAAFKSGWFVYTPKVEVIDLKFNRMTSVPARAFVQFAQLKSVDFSYNNIGVLEVNAFEGVASLDYLGLKYNRLIALDSLPKKIARLVINSNFFNYISTDTMKKVRIKELSLGGNPWTCSCLDKVRLWLYETNGTTVSLKDCEADNVPACVINIGECKERYNRELTRNFLARLRNLDVPVKKLCARLEDPNPLN